MHIAAVDRQIAVEVSDRSDCPMASAWCHPSEGRIGWSISRDALGLGGPPRPVGGDAERFVGRCDCGPDGDEGLVVGERLGPGVPSDSAATPSPGTNGQVIVGDARINADHLAVAVAIEPR